VLTKNTDIKFFLVLWPLLLGKTLNILWTLTELVFDHECNLDIPQLFLLVLVSLGNNGDDKSYLRLFFIAVPPSFLVFEHIIPLSQTCLFLT